MRTTLWLKFMYWTDQSIYKRACNDTAATLLEGLSEALGDIRDKRLSISRHDIYARGKFTIEGALYFVRLVDYHQVGRELDQLGERCAPFDGRGFRPRVNERLWRHYDYRRPHCVALGFLRLAPGPKRDTTSPNSSHPHTTGDKGGP